MDRSVALMQHSNNTKHTGIALAKVTSRPSWIRRGILRGLTLSPVSSLWAPFLGGRALILMFHRFSSGDHYSPTLFHRCLGYLRSRRYAIMDLEALLRAGLEGRLLPRRTVALTFDDGYQDQFDVALPLLAEFDAPATFFLASGFTDGHLWMWWDQIEYLVHHASRPTLNLILGGRPARYDLSPGGSRTEVVNQLVDHCKGVSNGELQETVRALAAAAECELPATPPPEYRGLTWEEARIAERFGVRFGPATVSHPILSRVDDATAEYEITQSWRRVKEELADPTPIFGYPNGKPGDFGPREMQLCARAGLLGAVSAEHRYLLPQSLSAGPGAAFALPRFSAPETFAEMVRLSSGLQVLLASILH